MLINLLRLLAGRANKLPERIDEYLFPALCIICNSPRESGNRWFCFKCRERLAFKSSSRKYCLQCSQNLTIRKCSCHISWEHPFDKIYSIFDYDEDVQYLVHNFKYCGKKSLASFLATFLPYTDEIKNSFDCVIPVPLHWTRHRNRGYNQAEWFAKGIAAQTGLPLYANTLLRSRMTRTQTKFDRTERQSNMENAFRVHKKNIKDLKDKRILLSDDVVTTGATTASCSEALLEAGCKSVCIISIARD